MVPHCMISASRGKFLLWVVKSSFELVDLPGVIRLVMFGLDARANVNIKFISDKDKK